MWGRGLCGNLPQSRVSLWGPGESWQGGGPGGAAGAGWGLACGCGGGSGHLGCVLAGKGGPMFSRTLGC